jgi:GT2 family glycosyltransferase
VSTVSVIIATYNRASLLEECLQHLAQQSFGRGDEVVIADNGSTDQTGIVVARHAPTFPASLSRIVEPTPGKSHAVASALRVASGAIVALTDDDVNVSKDWLSELRGALTDDDVGVAGGPVDPRWEHPAPAWLQLAGHKRLGAPLGLLDYGPTPAALGARTLLGSNMAVRRSVLQQLGGFSPRLGKLRGTLLSGEDHELCHRIQTAGFGARYVPSARVTHWVPATRMRLGYFLGWFYWSGITHAVLEQHGAASPPTLGVTAHLVRQFVGGAGCAAISALTGRRPAAVDRLVDSAFAAGYAAGRLGLAGAAPPPAPQVARSL